MSLVDDLLTYAEAAEALLVSRRTITRLVAEGHLHPVTLPGQSRRFIERRELERYAATRRPAQIWDMP